MTLWGRPTPPVTEVLATEWRTPAAVPGESGVAGLYIHSLENHEPTLGTCGTLSPGKF